MMLKIKSYQLARFGFVYANVLIKKHAFRQKYQAIIEFPNGKLFELTNEYTNEESFDLEVEQYVNTRINNE
jgi:hypothetical protein